MESLVFKIERGFAVSTLRPVQIYDNDLAEYKDRVNKEYGPFIKKINETGAYVAIIISNDGKAIQNYALRNCTDKVLDEWYEWRQQK